MVCTTKEVFKCHHTLSLHGSLGLGMRLSIVLSVVNQILDTRLHFVQVVFESYTHFYRRPHLHLIDAKGSLTVMITEVSPRGELQLAIVATTAS